MPISNKITKFNIFITKTKKYSKFRLYVMFNPPHNTSYSLSWKLFRKKMEIAQRKFLNPRKKAFSGYGQMFAVFGMKSAKEYELVPFNSRGKVSENSQTTFRRPFLLPSYPVSCNAANLCRKMTKKIISYIMVGGWRASAIHQDNRWAKRMPVKFVKSKRKKKLFSYRDALTRIWKRGDFVRLMSSGRDR